MLFYFIELAKPHYRPSSWYVFLCCCIVDLWIFMRLFCIGFVLVLYWFCIVVCSTIVIKYCYTYITCTVRDHWNEGA